MRFGRDELVFKALVALDEAAHAAYHGPVQPSSAIRFALAFLYAHSRGDRRPYDGFWRTMQSPPRDRPGREDDYIRFTGTCAYLKAIMRSVGYPEWPAAHEALSRAWRPRRTPESLPPTL